MAASPTDYPSVARDFDDLLAGRPGETAAVYSSMRSAPPLFSERFNGWVFSTYSDVVEVLKDEDRFPPLLHGPGTSSIYGRTVLQMSGREHARVVAPVAKAIRSPRELEGEILGVVKAVVSRYVNVVLSATGPIDLRAAFFSPYPMAVIAELMGIPAGANFRKDYAAVVRAATSNVSGDPEVTRLGEEARARVFEFLDPAIQESLLEVSGDGLLDAVCELVRNGTLPSIDAAKSYALFIFIGGVETTERTLTNIVATCMRNPGIWSMMRTNRDLVAPVIVETLRLDPPVHALSRGVSRPTELSGVKLSPGDRVLVALGAANRDPSVFANPDEFDPVRFLGRESREFTPASEIVSFGAGVHHCTGSRLSKLEMEVALNALLDEVSLFEAPTGVAPAASGYVLRAPESLHAVIVRD